MAEYSVIVTDTVVTRFRLSADSLEQAEQMAAERAETGTSQGIVRQRAERSTESFLWEEPTNQFTRGPAP